MTREEAIKIIDCYDIGFYDLSGEKIPADKLADAFDMAIEALSADAVKVAYICDSRACNGDCELAECTHTTDIEHAKNFIRHGNRYMESAEAEPDGDMGEVSDGYHTFNQLYHQRAVLFATIVKQNKEKAWKSWKHGDGKFCFDSNKEWFIVGVDTPEGSYTYHYEKKYWDMFDCIELEHGKFWDGHTEEDVTRLLSIPSAEAVSREEYEETDGVIEIKKQSAKDVGEIKHIVVCSPNYTRYFYNDSMPTQYKGGDTEQGRANNV